MRRNAIAGWVLMMLLLANAPLTGAPAASAGDVVDRFFDAYRAGDVEAMIGLYTPDAVFEDVNQRHRFEGADQLRAFLTQLVMIHAEIGLSERRRAVMGSQVVVEYEYTGLLDGEKLRAVSGDPACRTTRYALPVTTWFEVKNGRIVGQKDFIDLATFQEIQAQVHGESAVETPGS